MSEASDTTAPYSEKNLTDDNFYDMLKGLDVTKKRPKKVKERIRILFYATT